MNDDLETDIQLRESLNRTDITFQEHSNITRTKNTI